MACETAKEAWDRLRVMGSDTTRNIQVMNLRREFEMLRMQEMEKVKKYVDRLMSVVNKIRLLGVEMSDKMIVEKVLVSLPERFESKISSLEDSKDLSQISLTELVHALQAQEQRRLMRQEDTDEGAMMAVQKGNNRVTQRIGAGLGLGSNVKVANSLGILRKFARTKVHNHHNKLNLQRINSRAMSLSNCLYLHATQLRPAVWLIDSGCTNQMAANLQNFIRLDKTYNSRVKIGNGEYVEAKGIGDVAVLTQSGTKKNEVAAVFRKFKLLVENQAGTMIKAIKSDNGT
ncbi:uncharacterized protein LOC116110636 [Pistacia vera]|uniref:uncharacterized protein LOC116110636 n=1 Tax=Pistacia vera TaxID=55513 RepID=UPI00126337EC|nr:uncharacterized protein LOC116110636 [Pistacia vera]